MPKYKKGLTTEINILNSAKELFYKYGYTNASIKEICENASVRIGTFTYYYKKKEDLIKAIYADYLMRNYVFVDANSPIRLNSIQKNAYAILPYYRGLFIDEKTQNFHFDILASTSMYDFMHTNLTRIYASFIRDLNLNITQYELRIISSADLGVRRELTLEYLNGEFIGDSTELYVNIYRIMGRLFKMPERLMEQYIQEAIEFSNDHDFSSIKLLI